MRPPRRGSPLAPQGRGCVRRLGLRRVVVSGLLIAGCGGPDEPPPQASADELVRWGQKRLEGGRLEPATAAFRMALQRDSLHIDALAGLASVYQRQSKAEAADTYRRRAFHLGYSRGLASLEASQPDSARLQFAAAARVMPNHPLAYLRLGELAQAAGQLDSAIAWYERAVSANPRYAEALVALGRAYAAAARAEEARQAFERAIAANLNAFDAYIGLGRLFTEEQEWAAAAAQYSKALLIDPRSEVALHGLEQARAHL